MSAALRVGLRLGDPKVTALLATLVGRAGLFTEFSNPQLVDKVASLLDRPYTSGQTTSDLRRPRRKD